MGPTYQGLLMVVSAIDALALLIGRESYFWAQDGGATGGERERDRIEREAEAGLRQWKE